MTTTPVLWKAYSREQIPKLFGLEFSGAVWNKGFVRRDDKTFLLVTLDKAGKAEEHQYEDHFESADVFEWQSQNQTRRDSPTGESIAQHESLGIEIHLFVRAKSKTAAGTANPFVYCGPVRFVSWEKDSPITVTWRLGEPVPERLQTEFIKST